MYSYKTRPWLSSKRRLALVDLSTVSFTQQPVSLCSPYPIGLQPKSLLYAAS